MHHKLVRTGLMGITSVAVESSLPMDHNLSFYFPFFSFFLFVPFGVAYHCAHTHPPSLLPPFHNLRLYAIDPQCLILFFAVNFKLHIICTLSRDKVDLCIDLRPAVQAIVRLSTELEKIEK